MASEPLRTIFLHRGLAALSVVLCACAPHEDTPGTSAREPNFETPDSRTISAQFVSIAENAVSDGIVEGIQFALVEDGAVLTTKGLGLADREMNVPMTADTPINVASISKPVTAWGMLALAQRKNIDLDSPVRNLLSEGELYDKIFPETEVSLLMLLSHTSGLSGPSVPVTPATEPLPSVTSVLLGKSTVPRPILEHPPGTRFMYSGAGYLILQEIIKNQSQTEFAEFMSDVVLEPAGMLDSTYALAPDYLERVAVYYRADGRRREPYHLPGAAGGLYSTATDMARFIMMYTSSGYAIREKIISDEAYVELLNPIAASVEYRNQGTNIQYALGHYTYETKEGVKIAFHEGGNPGLRTIYVVAVESEFGFFAAVNNDRGAEVLSEMLITWGDYYGLTLHPYR